MELTTEKKELYQNVEVEVEEVNKISHVKRILGELLYVPDESLKPRIISEIATFYKLKTKNEEDKIAMFLATRNGVWVGFVFCQIDRDFHSYGMPCPTFGWLYAQNFGVCKSLMTECEKFVKAHKINGRSYKKLRGPINYPKKVGGIGFQTEGFSAPMMSGVAFNDPGSNVLAYLEALGYKIDAKYSCVDAFVKKWEKGKELDSNIVARFLPLNEIRALKAKILDLAKQSLHAILADATGGKHRFEEIMDIYFQGSKKFLVLHPDFDPQTYADMPGFLDTWNNADLENIIPTCIYGFDKTTGELVGVLMAQPNLYQLWKDEPLSHMNVDTVIIKKEYAGKGIFSALHNIGKSLASAVYGFDYFEGTTIWANNDRAIKAIFPHSSPLRTHFVVQKRILRK